MKKVKRSLKGTALLTGAIVGSAFAANASNPTGLVDFNALGNGEELRSNLIENNIVSSLPSANEATNAYKFAEMKCGEGKCGEGKCGEKSDDKSDKKKDKKAEAKSDKKAEKTSEAKCGEATCGSKEKKEE